MNQATTRKARILVVDDDPGLLRLLTIRLRAENYDVEAVESAAQALAAARLSEIPVLNLFDLAQQLGLEAGLFAHLALGGGFGGLVAADETLGQLPAVVCADRDERNLHLAAPAAEGDPAGRDLLLGCD